MKKTIVTVLLAAMFGSFLTGCQSDADKQKQAEKQAEKAFQAELARMK